MTNRTELMKILQSKYPNMWMKEGELFSEGHKGSIWTGEGSYNNEDNNLFDYNAGFWDIKEKFYVMGIRKELRDILDEHGWYCEWHDGGTVFIFQN